MISKRLKNSSVYQLKTFLTKERKIPLKTKTIKEIEKLILKKRKKNWEFAGKIIDSKLYKLALLLLKKRNQATKYRATNKEVYYFDFSKLFNTMEEITAKGLKKGLFDYEK